MDMTELAQKQTQAIAELNAYIVTLEAQKRVLAGALFELDHERRHIYSTQEPTRSVIRSALYEAGYKLIPDEGDSDFIDDGDLPEPFSGVEYYTIKETKQG